MTPEQKLSVDLKKRLLQYLVDTKNDLEERGYIATLEKAIEEAERELEKDL